MVREGDKVWVKVRDVDVPWITASWWTWFQRREAGKATSFPDRFLVWGGKLHVFFLGGRFQIMVDWLIDGLGPGGLGFYC